MTTDPQPTPPTLSALAAREIANDAEDNKQRSYSSSLNAFSAIIARVVEAPLRAECENRILAAETRMNDECNDMTILVVAVSRDRDALLARCERAEAELGMLRELVGVRADVSACADDAHHWLKMMEKADRADRAEARVRVLEVKLETEVLLHHRAKTALHEKEALVANHEKAEAEVAHVREVLKGSNVNCDHLRATLAALRKSAASNL